MAPQEWDIRVALKQYQGEIPTEFIHDTLANNLNGPFFTCKQLPDESVIVVVRRIWWEFETLNYRLFLDDGREYLLNLMDLSAAWRVKSSDARLNAPQRSLLRFNSALIMMCITEVLGANTP